MAGANNAQMKTAGWKARDVTKQRAEHGRLSHAVMEASGAKPRKGFEPAARAKPGAKAESGAPAGWKAAARGEGGDARRAATAARGDYLKGQAAAAGQAKRADLAGRGARDLGASMLASRKAAAATEQSERAAGAAAMLAKNKAAAGKARRGELAGRGLRDVAGAMMARRKAAARPDPHAETRARIASLEEQLSTGKAVNKIIRSEQKKGGDWQARAVARLTKETRATDQQAQALVKPDFVGRYGVPDYEFTNKGATIRRLKDQIGMDRTRGKKWEERTIRGIGSYGPGAVVLR